MVTFSSRSLHKQTMSWFTSYKSSILDFVVILSDKVVATEGIWHFCSPVCDCTTDWRMAGVCRQNILHCDLARSPEFNGVGFGAELNCSSLRWTQIAVGSTVRQFPSRAFLWAGAWDWCFSGFWTIAQYKIELSNMSSLNIE